MEVLRHTLTLCTDALPLLWGYIRRRKDPKLSVSTLASVTHLERSVQRSSQRCWLCNCLVKTDHGRHWSVPFMAAVISFNPPAFESNMPNLCHYWYSFVKLSGTDHLVSNRKKKTIKRWNMKLMIHKQYTLVFLCIIFTTWWLTLLHLWE